MSEILCINVLSLIFAIRQKDYPHHETHVCSNKIVFTRQKKAKKKKKKKIQESQFQLQMAVTMLQCYFGNLFYPSLGEAQRFIQQHLIYSTSKANTSNRLFPLH